MGENPFSLENATYLVTGASSGIGRACCVRLAALGARVVLTGRDEGRLEETRGLLHGEGHQARPFDLMGGEDAGKWLKGLGEGFGGLNGMVHCAGVHKVLPLRMVSEDAAVQIFRANVATAFNLAGAFSWPKVRQYPCSLVFLSSVVARAGQPAVSLYAASKGAIDAMVRSLALEFAPQGVRVNAVAPGLVKTQMGERIINMLPEEQLQRVIDYHLLGLGTPEDVANAVAFLLGDGARWITGTTLTVDGGYTAH